MYNNKMIKTFERPPVDVSTDDDIEMQILTWRTGDFKEHYTINFCGVTKSGDTIGVTVTDFKPFFYLKTPTNLRWTPAHTRCFSNWCEKTLHENELNTNVKIDSGLREVLYPFTDGKKFRFLKVTCREHSSMKKIYWKTKYKVNFGILRYCQFEAYEGNLDPMLRFGHLRELNMAGWVRIPGGNYKLTDYTKCQINIHVADSTLLQPYDSYETAQFSIASYDIECDSAETRDKNEHLYPQRKDKCRCVFPDYNNKRDAVKIICTTFKIVGTDKTLRHAIVWGETSDVPSADVLVRTDSERELFREWIKMCQVYDPDVLIGYNIYGFDDRYMYNRMTKLYGLGTEIANLSRIRWQNPTLKDSKLVTSAYGTNFFKIFDIPGVYKIDLYVWMKREEKLDSYKLNNVAKVFLGTSKIDLPPLDLFYYMNGTPDQMRDCVEYCVQDTKLPLDILEHRKIFVNLIQMANITRVPIEWLITKGQQIKVFSQLAYECRKDGILIPTGDDKKKEQEKFVGATVLDPIKGYYKQPIAGLDFASLYPSIMIADNLCYSTFIPEDKVALYKDRKDLDIFNIKWESVDEDEKTIEYSFHFVQNKQGVLPRILEKLWKSRKLAKKEMKNAKAVGDTNLADVYNGKQLAIKVTMNSVYGFTGATNGYMPMKIIASSVTARGRQLIDQTKSFCETNYDCEVIYGDTDSCYVKFNDGDPSDPNYMKDYFKLCEDAALAVTAQFKKPIELEFEKVMQPTLLFAKKRYACRVWTNPVTPDYIDCKGIQVVRRDSCEYVKQTSKRILAKIMEADDIPGAISEAEDCVSDLMYGNVEPNSLLLSKSLRTGYKCSRCHKLDSGEIPTDVCRCPEGPRVNLPHVQLVNKMKARNAVDIPQPGDRVPYFFTKGVGLQAQRVEDPLYMNKTNPEGKLCPLDALYYLDHQLKKPIITLLELVMEDTSVLFENGPCGDTIEELQAEQKEMNKEYRAAQRQAKLDHI